MRHSLFVAAFALLSATAMAQSSFTVYGNNADGTVDINGTPSNWGDGATVAEHEDATVSGGKYFTFTTTASWGSCGVNSGKADFSALADNEDVYLVFDYRTTDQGWIQGQLQIRTVDDNGNWGETTYGGNQNLLVDGNGEIDLTVRDGEWHTETKNLKSTWASVSAAFAANQVLSMAFLASNSNASIDIANIRIVKTKEHIAIGDAGYATFSALYDGLDFTDVTNIYAYKAVVDYDKAKVNLTRVNTVAKGEGVLLRSVYGGAATAEVPYSSTVVKSDDNAFIAVLDDAVVKDAYVLSKVDNVVGFFAADAENGAKLSAGTAYLPKDASATAKSLSFTFDDSDVAAISTPKTQKIVMGDSTIYNINGQRVANPTKGLYIVNGKKVFMK